MQLNRLESLQYDLKDQDLIVNVLQNYHLECIRKIYFVSSDRVNIFASGSSIANLDFSDELLEEPAIFVNGSISLTHEFLFKNQVAYVISDARFIEHNYDVFLKGYIGQPLFITQAVLEKIIRLNVKLIMDNVEKIYLIHAIDRPIKNPRNGFLKKVISKHKLNLAAIVDPNIVVNAQHNPVIGVSLNICKGFVEAGTVTYIATQLAKGFGARKIYLYGMDLINSHQPRFYENQKNQAPCKLDQAVENRIIPSFDLLAEQYLSLGVEVYNCSPISKDLFKILKFHN